ncbi:MAG: sodium:calcium antiporter [Chloroflexota bacterium]
MPTSLIFLLSATAVVLAGMRLARDGDTIAEQTGLGRAWVGAILVAGATSLPELSTNSYSVMLGNVNLAAGDLFGSNMVNMLILALADVSVRQQHILTRVAMNQALVGTLAIWLTAAAIAGVVAGPTVTVLGLGWGTIAILIGYVAGTRVLFANRTLPAFESWTEAAEHRASAPPLRPAIIMFAIAAAIIFVAAQFLATSAADLADQLGVSKGFVGVAMLAIVTSLPEAIVSVSSIRNGSYDLAVGNLLGSNCFNMVIFVVLDIVDGPGSVLARIDGALVIGGAFAILLVGLALIDILHRAERRIWLMEPGPGLMIPTYLLGLYFVYQIG